MQKLWYVIIKIHNTCYSCRVTVILKGKSWASPRVGLNWLNTPQGKSSGGTYLKAKNQVSCWSHLRTSRQFQTGRVARRWLSTIKGKSATCWKMLIHSIGSYSFWRMAVLYKEIEKTFKYHRQGIQKSKY